MIKRLGITTDMIIGAGLVAVLITSTITGGSNELQMTIVGALAGYMGKVATTSQKDERHEVA